MMIPGTKVHMLESEYWINKIAEPDKVIMESEKINEFNECTIKKVKSMCNIREYKEKISKTELVNIISNYKIPKNIRYNTQGIEVKAKFYDEIIKNINIATIGDNNEVNFGVAIKSTRVRSFPTSEGNFKSVDDMEFDRFQETECDALQPVAILHVSLDTKWFFIQMYNYNGWVMAENIAVGKTKNEVFNYLDTEHFLIVTGNRVTTQFNHNDSRVSRQDFYMGARLPLETEFVDKVGNQSAGRNYIVKLPVRDGDGKLEIRNGVIAFVEDINFGYLPYTRRNILGQAFKLQGDRYDWGNKNNGRDCSSFLMKVYMTFGIILPRNVDEQKGGEGLHYEFNENSSITDRNKVFENVAPGAGIFKDDHVMMYIGVENGEHFMIHDFHRYGVQENNIVKAIDVNEIAVTSTMLTTTDGEKYIQKFTSLVQFEIL